MENIKAPAVVALSYTSARIANPTAKSVDTIAASWGLWPKGTAVKNDQLARERPNRELIARTKRTCVFRKMQNRHTNATTIHAGRYARVILICQELTMGVRNGTDFKTTVDELSRTLFWQNHPTPWLSYDLSVA